MKIEADKFVAIHYTLKDDNGTELDSSVGGAPLGYVHGHGYLIVGLENELLGKEPGDKFSAVIAPKDGYGEYDSRLVADVPVEVEEYDTAIDFIVTPTKIIETRHEFLRPSKGIIWARLAPGMREQIPPVQELWCEVHCK